MSGLPRHDPSTSPFLRPETEAVSEVIAGLGSVRRYATGEFVYRQGESTPYFHQVASGRIRIFFTLPDGAERVLSYAERGAGFGESGCFDGLPRYASSVATEPSEIITVHRQDLVEAAATQPAIMLEVARRLAHKQRVLSLHIVADGLPARARVAMLLLHLAGAYGTPEPGARVTVTAPHRLDELALLVGVTRVTVSRELSRLVEAGIVVKQGRDIVIVDVPGLEWIVHGRGE